LEGRRRSTASKKAEGEVMNSERRFTMVYRLVEGVYGRVPPALEIQRAYKRYLHVTGEEAAL
jgi:hypothetical protein